MVSMADAPIANTSNRGSMFHILKGRASEPYSTRFRGAYYFFGAVVLNFPFQLI